MFGGRPPKASKETAAREREQCRARYWDLRAAVNSLIEIETIQRFVLWPEAAVPECLHSRSGWGLSGPKGKSNRLNLGGTHRPLNSLPYRQEIPARFELSVSRLGLNVSRRVVWRRDHRMGVAFILAVPQPG